MDQWKIKCKPFLARSKTCKPHCLITMSHLKLNIHCHSYHYILIIEFPPKITRLLLTVWIESRSRQEDSC
ncbi:hypothetical protein PVAP13_9NG460614 [Panicum virgatum]|uniref:Uncharacterized protein n=1 Tax=Panicum virgatum TaxID=38727 RepID=A0A8T0MT53_PANVG|nr:hypothetical protein PVAP13_9NG460614 [Panicum virgatum]